MRAFFLFMLLCHSAVAQSIIVSGDHQSIVVSSNADPPQLTATSAAVVAEPVIVETPTPVPTKKLKQWFLVSESWCPHCPAAKRTFIAKGWPESNVLTIAQCKAKFRFTVPHVPYEFSEPEDIRVQQPQQVQLVRQSQPVRYIQWPGWGTIDLETYNRNCNCGMCRSIRAKQQEYRQHMQEYQSSIPDDQQPCPIALIEQMLDLMQLQSDDVLIDLGCGDGRILIAAAKRGIHGIGVELDHARAKVARQAVIDSGVSQLVSIEQGDARTFDTSRATAITAYLYPTLLAELAPKMKKARIVASPYHEVPGLAMVRHGDIWLHKRSEGLYGDVGTSHESRESLVKHMLTGEIHAGRWSSVTLNAMSDEQLNEAHSRDHR